MLVHNNYGLKINKGEFYLNLERPIEPKSLALNAESSSLEFFYIITANKSISLSFKEQIADTQEIECYTFSSLTIGFCENAVLTITNSKDKYSRLNDNKLMLLDASNNEISLNYTQAIDSIIADEFKLYLSASMNDFDWISPIEELTSGFIANLSYKGSKIGTLVSNEIRRLPQRDSFNLYKLGINFYNNIEIINNINIFYDLDLVFVDTKDYAVYKDINKSNFRFEMGFRALIEDITIYISGTFYNNNLFGYEDISFNQRSEHHFSTNFGTLNFKIKYLF